MATFDKMVKVHDCLLFSYFYRKVHKKSIRFLKHYIKGDPSVLDVGCGTGNFLNKLKKRDNSLQLFGIDESQKMIERAKKKFKKINFSQGTAENLAFPNSNFNLVTIIDGLHYFQNQPKALAECFRVLEPTGHLFICKPSIDNFLGKMSMWSSKWCFTEKGAKQLYLKELKEMAENNGFKFIKTKRINWPLMPFLKYWLVIFGK